jgi:hypothetical protein
MILETREIKEYHTNGQLMYETILNVIAPMFEPLYKNMIYNDKGEILIRTGITKRFHGNGQINWQLKYNEDGSLFNEKFNSFMKDGTIITY